MLFVLLACVGAALAATCTKATNTYCEGRWERLTSIRLAPLARGHAGLFAQDSVVIWGGVDSQLRAIRARSFYDTITEPFFWESTTSGTPSEGRAYTSWVNVNDQQLWMYGGQRLNSNVASVVSMTAGGAFEENVAFTSGGADEPNHLDFPSLGATAMLDDQGFMWLFGGFTDGGMLNLPTQVDLVNRVFITPTNEDKSGRPSRRFGASGSFALIEGRRYFYIQGGLRQLNPDSEAAAMQNGRFLYELDTGSWSTLGTNMPEALAYSSCSRMPGDTATVCFGGLVYDTDPPTNSIASVSSDAYVMLHSSLTQFSGNVYTITATGDLANGRGQFAQMLANINGEVSVLVQGGIDATGGGSILNTMYKLVFVECPRPDGNCFLNPSTLSGGTGGGGGGGTTDASANSSTADGTTGNTDGPANSLSLITGFNDPSSASTLLSIF